jgi:hypothetical protein
MIDVFSIFTKGGEVLFSEKQAAVEGQPIDQLVQKVLLEERAATKQYVIKDHTLKWMFHNALDLVFVAVYLNFSQLLYIDDLLAAIRKEFVKTYSAQIMANAAPSEFSGFRAKYLKILAKFEQEGFKGAVKTAMSMTKVASCRNSIQCSRASRASRRRRNRLPRPSVAQPKPVRT